MGCIRCLGKAAVASVTPVGGVILCAGCVEVVLTKTVLTLPIYFGRCYRDAFRLCLPECTHLSLGPTVDSDGTPKVEAAQCHASTEPYEIRDQNGGVVISGYPVNLRRRMVDEYLAALLLTTRPQELQEVAESGMNGGQAGKEEEKEEEEKDERGGYCEGDE